ncbi:peptidoglycan DD-metalloendopeptidase family protein [Legionella waltersii]|uniref:LysM domain-containing protein n=1 Tax=Legionella waltersii TaxID=66969 RepID=A0A0W1AM11_9GAMM|nr:peptidoglycan DD-metalloendopeptidase family protein [Legionella waltersii]KTD82395.1 hypothetical protein Lwal_0872 [Legionella waltersii]SNV03552.1 lipoprotein NlpD [Legionella waltersii]
MYLRRLIYFILIFILTGCETGNHFAPVTEVKWQTFSKNQSSHVVRQGETLYAISFRYDTDYRQLAALNHLRPPYALRVGQVINLRGVGHRVAPIKQISRPVYRPIYQPKQRVIYTPTSVKSPGKGWLWPVSGRVVTTFVPTQGKKGINIACNKGDRIRASSSGVVAYAGSGLAGYGNLIIIKHNNEYLTAYGYNAKILVREGQSVSVGQVIAEAGLVDRKYWGVHFEIRRAGVPVNPLNYLQKG